MIHLPALLKDIVFVFLSCFIISCHGARVKNPSPPEKNKGPGEHLTYICLGLKCRDGDPTLRLSFSVTLNHTCQFILPIRPV